MVIGVQEIVIILFILALIFGAGQIPKLARSLGESVREFKKATKEVEETKKEIIGDENLQEAIKILKKLSEKKPRK